MLLEGEKLFSPSLLPFLLPCTFILCTSRGQKMEAKVLVITYSKALTSKVGFVKLVKNPMKFL